MKYLFFLLLIISLSCTGQIVKDKTIAEKGSKSGYVNYTIPLKKLVDSLALKKANFKIVVVKSKYVLSIVIDSTIIKSYPVVFGFNAVDDKFREGDGCTPEGKFKIKAMYPHKSWSKFIWFDYPNGASRIKHQQAKKNGVIPSNAGIGGDVGIHGVPKGYDYAIDKKQNWTLGCVSLKNKDIDEIYSFAFVGMSIEIIQL